MGARVANQAHLLVAARSRLRTRHAARAGAGRPVVGSLGAEEHVVAGATGFGTFRRNQHWDRSFGGARTARRKSPCAMSISPVGQICQTTATGEVGKFTAPLYRHSACRYPHGRPVSSQVSFSVVRHNVVTPARAGSRAAAGWRACRFACMRAQEMLRHSLQAKGIRFSALSASAC